MVKFTFKLDKKETGLAAVGNSLQSADVEVEVPPPLIDDNQNIILTSKTVTAMEQMTPEEFFSKNGRKAFQDAKRTLENKRTCLNEGFKWINF